MTPATLVLSAAEVRALLPVGDCIEAVERGFRAEAEGTARVAPVLGIPVPRGGFHLKTAVLQLDRAYFAAKLNGNFPDNPTRHGLPTIQGIVALCDASDGRLLALVDSSEITRLRTGAATGVAAKHLARQTAASLTLFGCGRQGRIQVECLHQVLPLTRVWVHDSLLPVARSTAEWLGAELGLEAVPVDREEALRRAGESDVIVTATPSRRCFLGLAQVSPGTFVAAVGADDADKQELDPALLAAATLVVDGLEQCAAIGELHHALSAGVLEREDVHATLADVVAGRKPGRSDPQEITVFDSTGTALEDVVTTVLVYQRALTTGQGLSLQLA